MQSAFELVVVNWTLVRSLARAGGFAAVLPSIGIIGPGVRPRVLFSAVLALVIAGAGPAMSDEPVTARDMAASVAVELVSGAILGFTLRAALASIQIVAHAVEQQFGMTAFGDSTEECAPPIGGLYQIVALAMFVSMSGHRAVIAALLQIGDGAGMIDGMVGLTDTAARLVTASWYLAIQSVLPLVISLMTARLAAGMIARVLPQINVTSVTVPVHITVGFLLVLVSLASVSVSFGRGLNWALSAFRGP